MNPTPPFPPAYPMQDQRKIDGSHLDLLSIFHFVGAGLAVIALLLLVAHYAFFHAIMENPQFWENHKQTPPPPEILAIFKWFYVIFCLWFITSAVLNVISGICLRTRKNRTFSFVVAAIDCLHIPLGTILGIFTIIILSRESVRELYDARPPS